MPIRLDVPYADKDQAKALGARWNPKGRFWYVPDGVLVTPFEPWVPDSDTPASGASSENGSAARPPKQEATARPGSKDLVVGKTNIGSQYFDTGHDCIPWLPCEQCTAAVKAHVERLKEQP
ncbi:MAG: DUF5710 domain-containing protein [Massilia sp.]